MFQIEIFYKWLDKQNMNGSGKMAREYDYEKEDSLGERQVTKSASYSFTDVLILHGSNMLAG